MENTAHTEALWNDSDLFVDFSDGKNYSALFTSLKFTGKVSENNKTVSTLRKTVSTNNYYQLYQLSINLVHIISL